MEKIKKITHFGGTVDCTTTVELKNILNTRYGENSNNFWIAGNEKYPLLSILVKDDFTDFYVNTPTEIVSVENNFVIPFSTAPKAAEEFFLTLSKPSCIGWFEL